MIDFHEYHIVLINSSAGKDSQVMLDEVVRVADDQKFSRGRLIVAHADLGIVEWPGTRQLVQDHADHYGLRVEYEKRPQGDLLEHVEQRGKWPSPTQRYCTSDHKRGQVSKIFTRLVKEQLETGIDKPVRILQCFGFRSQESPARAKKKVFAHDERMSNTKRHIDAWLPIHTWSVEQVWERINSIDTDHHWAYSRGMTRLSCRFCIFAPKSQLMLSASQPENAELFEKYVQVETKIGHTFKHKESLAEIKEALDAGEEVTEEDSGCWNM